MSHLAACKKANIKYEQHALPRSTSKITKSKWSTNILNVSPHALLLRVLWCCALREAVLHCLLVTSVYFSYRCLSIYSNQSGRSPLTSHTNMGFCRHNCSTTFWVSVWTSTSCLERIYMPKCIALGQCDQPILHNRSPIEVLSLPY